MPIEYMSQFDVLQIRTKLAARHGTHFDIMNTNSLLAALAAPKQAFFGEEMFPAVWDKAAMLLLALIRNHPFYDGNKRIAYTAAREFLERNGYALHVTEAEAAAFTKHIALGNVEAPEIAAWLQARCTAA